jgi:hypothetical protein
MVELLLVYIIKTKIIIIEDIYKIDYIYIVKNPDHCKKGVIRCPCRLS